MIAMDYKPGSQGGAETIPFQSPSFLLRTASANLIRQNLIRESPFFFSDYSYRQEDCRDYKPNATNIEPIYGSPHSIEVNESPRSIEAQRKPSHFLRGPHTLVLFPSVFHFSDGFNEAGGGRRAHSGLFNLRA